ncbi:MAG: hypothetical protein OHK0015_04500 [Chloroflexi bacterium OHK40]
MPNGSLAVYHARAAEEGFWDGAGYAALAATPAEWGKDNGQCRHFLSRNWRRAYTASEEPQPPAARTTRRCGVPAPARPYHLRFAHPLVSRGGAHRWWRRRPL